VVEADFLDAFLDHWERVDAIGGDAYFKWPFTKK
jgi:hypothetical protein